MTPAIELTERQRTNFEAKIDRSPNLKGCHLWTGARTSAGYGGVSLGQGNVHYTHRLSYQLNRGEIPKGLLVLHRCDVRNCVNPEHLFIGTEKDNIDDMWKKKRRVQLRGKDSPRFGKKRILKYLTMEIAEQIRALYKPREFGCIKLARMFDTSPGVVLQVVNGKTWNKVNKIPKGESHRWAKLDAAKVLEIRAKHTSGNVTFASLAKEYGVAHQTIRHIVKRQTWAHI